MTHGTRKGVSRPLPRSWHAFLLALNADRARYKDIGLIIGLPKFKSKGSWDHMQLLIREAAKLDSGWPFEYKDPPAITKTADTYSMKTHKWKTDMTSTWSC